jgi:type VI secretion system secreted protein VgrG
MSFEGWTDNRRTTRLVLMGIILLTLPCYCLGVILLATAPEDAKDRPTSIPVDSTLGGVTVSPNTTPTNTPFRTATFTPFGNPLGPTPTQYFLYPTAYVPTAIPTNTFVPVATAAPTLTTAPSVTPVPTNTLSPSDTPVPTDTLVPTDIPEPTETPVPTDTLTQPPPPNKPPDGPGQVPTPTQETL